MKAVVYKCSQNKAELMKIQKPELNNDEAMVKVKYAGICGADLALIKGERKIISDVIPGHEIIGIVTAVKNGDKNLIGKRVAVEPTISCGDCQMCKLDLPHICYNLKVLGVHVSGGMAEYVKVPAKKLHIIPDRITNERAAIIEPLAVAIHVVRRSRLEIGDNVLIVGGGPIGLLIAQICRAAGAGKIKIIEINPFRQNLCRQLGFDSFAPDENINNSEKAYGFAGFDICYEVSGSNGGMEQIIRNVRGQGKVIIVGLFKESYPIKFSEVLFKELEIIGSRVYRSHDFDVAIELLLADKINVEPIITNILKLENFEKGFKLASDGKAMKVILEVN